MRRIYKVKGIDEVSRRKSFRVSRLSRLKPLAQKGGVEMIGIILISFCRYLLLKAYEICIMRFDGHECPSSLKKGLVPEKGIKVDGKEFPSPRKHSEGLNGKFRKFILWVKRHACLRQRVKLQNSEKELRRAGRKSAFSKLKVYFLNQPRFNFCIQDAFFKPLKTLINQQRVVHFLHSRFTF